MVFQVSRCLSDEDAETIYAEMPADTEALVDNALPPARPYPGSLLLSSAFSVFVLGTLALFGHNTTHFSRWDVVRVPLDQEGISFGNVLR
jgi:hypothetical protein